MNFNEKIELTNIYYTKNKNNRLKRNLFIISVLLILPVFLPLIQVEFGYEVDTFENHDYENLRNSNVYYRDFSGDGWDIFISGDYAFIADGGISGSLVVIDISDPNNPGSPVYKATDDSAFGVFVSGDYAYLGVGSEGFAVIDVSDPTHPGSPLYEPTDDFANGLYVSGDYAYVADGTAGLAVIDISDPTNPGIAAHESTSNYAYDVHVSGDYAYVADGSAGLAVIDISNPTNPGTAVFENTNGNAMALYVEGDYAYVADSGSGLAIIDISDPTNPGTPVYANTDGSAYSVYVDGDYAYVADYYKGIAVIDISDPTNPTKIAQGSLDEHVYAISIDGNYAFLAGDGLYSVEISELISPLETWWNEDTSGNSQGVFVSGNYAYVADGASGLAVIDVSDPTTPGTPQYSNTAGDAEDVVVSGDYAYVADGGGGLAVIDVSDPTSPGTPVRRDTTGDSKGIFVSGDYAYIADGASGLAIIDISNPSSPGSPIYKNDGYTTTAVYVEGNYAYLSAGTGILTIDISDPTTPGPSVYLSLVGGARDIYVRGDYAYLSIYSDIATVDISDPSNPVVIDKEPVYHSSPEGIFVSGEYAYSAEDYGSMGGYIKIWDISNPSHISFVGSLYIAGTNGGDGALESFVIGNYIYVADSGSGLLICEIRERVDTKNPVITQSPSDKIFEAGYTGKTLNWRATDSNPNTYIIELEGVGNVAGPIAWSSGSLVTYNIPEGLSVGEYDYTITFTDDHGFYATDSVKVTVQDTENPVIIVTPSDLKVLSGYTGQSFSWTATDANPDTYTVELQGTGIVAGPTAWLSGFSVTYDIPNALSLGEYFYTINFTDDYEHFITDTVKLTVYEPDDPVITDNAIDILVGPAYSGLNFSWTATDANPDTYTIELEGGGIVAGPTPWSSGIAVTYDIPDGMKIRQHNFTINFTDTFDNYVIDTVKLTIQDTNPLITNAPDDISLFTDYNNVQISWTATDEEDPNMYTIELQGSGIVAGPTSWSSGVAVTYDIPEGLLAGEHFYTINYTDETGNSITDEVKITVKEDSLNPIITYATEDQNFEYGYEGEVIVWRATDENPNIYTIELQGSGIIVGPSPWFNGSDIIYSITEGLSIGDYFFTINITDDAGNFVTDTIKVTIYEDPPGDPPAIPFGNYFLVFMSISIIALIFLQRRKK